MKRVIAGVLLVMAVSAPVFAEEVEKSFLTKVEDSAALVWNNTIPAGIRIANSVIHFVCGKVHDGLHSVAEFLNIEKLP